MITEIFQLLPQNMKLLRQKKGVTSLFCRKRFFEEKLNVYLEIYGAVVILVRSSDEGLNFRMLDFVGCTQLLEDGIQLLGRHFPIIVGVKKFKCLTQLQCIFVTHDCVKRASCPIDSTLETER